MALPGTGQSFARFRADDTLCRTYASQALGGTTPAQAGVDAGVASAAVGTLLGAAVGAAVDGSSGAAVGAGVGLLVGSASGVASSNASSYTLQQRYDQSYVQCMYARGQKVPVIGNFAPPEGYATRAPARCRRRRVVRHRLRRRLVARHRPRPRASALRRIAGDGGQRRCRGWRADDLHGVHRAHHVH